MKKKKKSNPYNLKYYSRKICSPQIISQLNCKKITFSYREENGSDAVTM